MSVSLRPVEESEVDDVQAVIDSDPGYAARVTGLPPGPADAQSLLLMRPPDLPEDHKTVYGVRDAAGALVGLLDVLRGYPDRATAYLGLLQVRGDRQGEGIGRAAHVALLDVVAGWPEIRTIRLAVVETNRTVAEPFWLALGYRPAGEPVPYRYANLETTVQRYELAVRGD